MCLGSGRGGGVGLVCAVWVAGQAAAADDRGVLPVTPFAPWCLVPGNRSGAGGDHAGWVLSLRARRSGSVFPCAAPRAASSLLVRGEGEAAVAARKKNMIKGAAPGSPAAPSAPGGDGAEVAGERVEVVTYAAAVDVAGGSGMVC